ncbi:DHHW family protein [Ruminococcus sp.]|uniref:DHHW family protein n=1 Tax=Ruminococcus sp. TaxID=41978 RepID=UPI0025E236C6|nr:DHHW family protein [Ruminococcus sp.]MBQ8968050.1 hypothetical protein [Ruminococcus sp.]
MSDMKKNNRRSPAVDLEALSKAYEQSLNNVTLGGKDIPTPEVKRKTAPAPERELKSFVPRDYRPVAEASPEHDKIVDKIRADRRKRSHSVWTDNPVLKPKKSVWIDDADEGASVPERRPAPVQQPRPVQNSYVSKKAAPKQAAPVPQPVEKKQLPPDFIAPLPVMTRPPEPEPVPDFGALVDEALGDRKPRQVVPLLNEKPRKQELVMRVDAEGDTRVRELPRPVNKQKVMVDMSGYEEDTPTKRSVSLKMPLWKMKLDDLQPEKEEKEPESEKAEAPADEEAAKEAAAVQEDLEKTAEYKVVKKQELYEEDEAEEEAEETPEEEEVPEAESEAEEETDGEEEDEEYEDEEDEQPAGDGEYNFSAMFKKVRAEKKDRVREEFDNSDPTEHTLITDKAQRHGVEPRYIMKPRKLSKRKKSLNHELEFQFINCIMCICVVFVIFFSLLFMERETGFINSENRNLAEFPEFSISDYFSGKYTKGIDDYFTDTIPGREELKQFAAVYDRMKGIDLGGAKVSGTHKTAEKEKLDEEKLAAVTTVTANTDPKAMTTTTTKKSDNSKAETATTKKEEVVKLPEILDDGVMEGDVIVFGKGKDVRAVAGYYGMFETGALYAHTINKYKEAMPEVNVYNMTIPTSAAYYMPNNFKDTVADQKDNIDNIASELSGIINVDVYDELLAHTDEYIYSRTDHHWQPLGAYYAGKVFAEKAGVKYADLKTYEECKIEDFLGTMYAYSNYDSELQANPDTFIYYKPDNEYRTFYHNTDFTNGEEGSLFFDFAEGVNCYSAIMGKDEEITEILTDADNGRTLVIFKDSFGNALVPFFTHSFEKIYVCDFRYFDENAIDFCRAVGCTDLLFSISITSCSTEMHITAINNDRIQESAAPLPTQADEPAESAAEPVPEAEASDISDSSAGENDDEELGG